MSERRLLHKDPYITVHLETKLQLVAYVRHATPFPNLETARRMYLTLIALDTGAATRLLTDVRDSPGNNAPEYEALITELGQRFFNRFKKRAVVVRSVVGKLQIERLATDRSKDVFRVFNDDESARRWLLE
jgi:hypothetical protein